MGVSQTAKPHGFGDHSRAGRYDLAHVVHAAAFLTHEYFVPSNGGAGRIRRGCDRLHLVAATDGAVHGRCVAPRDVLFLPATC